MPDLLPFRPWFLVAAILLCLALGGWLGSRVRRFWMRRRLARRWGRARQGEAQACGWLERHGFTVLDEQVNQPSMLIVDGEESPFTVRADYLVERNGVRAVVEVKTGAVADPSSRATRRQILEYARVYGVTEVYLFDADAQRLHHIGIPAMPGGVIPTPRTAWPVVVGFASGAALGGIAAWWLLR